jgi:hypothetical protein
MIRWLADTIWTAAFTTRTRPCSTSRRRNTKVEVEALEIRCVPTHVAAHAALTAAHHHHTTEPSHHGHVSGHGAHHGHQAPVHHAAGAQAEQAPATNAPASVQQPSTAKVSSAPSQSSAANLHMTTNPTGQSSTTGSPSDPSGGTTGTNGGADDSQASQLLQQEVKDFETGLIYLAAANSSVQNGDLNTALQDLAAAQQYLNLAYSDSQGRLASGFETQSAANSDAAILSHFYALAGNDIQAIYSYVNQYNQYGSGDSSYLYSYTARTNSDIENSIYDIESNNYDPTDVTTDAGITDLDSSAAADSSGGDGTFA